MAAAGTELPLHGRMSSGDIVQMFTGDDAELQALLSQQTEALPPVAATEALNLERLAIQISKHFIHREDKPGTPEHTYVVSTFKWLVLELQLVDAAGMVAVHNTLDLEAALCFENGDPVEMEQTLIDEHRRAHSRLPLRLVNGSAKINLKLSEPMLSSKFSPQRQFRLRFRPADAWLQTRYPRLTTHTVPMKSVTKLFRGPKAGTDLVPSPAGLEQLQQQFDEEKGLRAVLSVQVSELERRLRAEQAAREAMQREHAREMGEQRRAMAQIMEQFATLGVAPAAKGGRPPMMARPMDADRLMPPPAAPEPERLRSRSPKLGLLGA